MDGIDKLRDRYNEVSPAADHPTVAKALFHEWMKLSLTALEALCIEASADEDEIGSTKAEHVRELMILGVEFPTQGHKYHKAAMDISKHLSTEAFAALYPPSREELDENAPDASASSDRLAAQDKIILDLQQQLLSLAAQVEHQATGDIDSGRGIKDTEIGDDIANLYPVDIVSSKIMTGGERRKLQRNSIGQFSEAAIDRLVPTSVGDTFRNNSSVKKASFSLLEVTNNLLKTVQQHSIVNLKITMTILQELTTLVDQIAQSNEHQQEGGEDFEEGINPTVEIADLDANLLPLKQLVQNDILMQVDNLKWIQEFMMKEALKAANLQSVVKEKITKSKSCLPEDIADSIKSQAKLEKDMNSAVTKHNKNNSKKSLSDFRHAALPSPGEVRTRSEGEAVVAEAKEVKAVESDINTDGYLVGEFDDSLDPNTLELCFQAADAHFRATAEDIPDDHTLEMRTKAHKTLSRFAACIAKDKRVGIEAFEARFHSRPLKTRQRLRRAQSSFLQKRRKQAPLKASTPPPRTGNHAWMVPLFAIIVCGWLLQSVYGFEDAALQFDDGVCWGRTCQNKQAAPWTSTSSVWDFTLGWHPALGFDGEGHACPSREFGRFRLPSLHADKSNIREQLPTGGRARAATPGTSKATTATRFFHVLSGRQRRNVSSTIATKATSPSTNSKIEGRSITFYDRGNFSAPKRMQRNRGGAGTRRTQTTHADGGSVGKEAKPNGSLAKGGSSTSDRSCQRGRNGGLLLATDGANARTASEGATVPRLGITSIRSEQKRRGTPSLHELRGVQQMRTEGALSDRGDKSSPRTDSPRGLCNGSGHKRRLPGAGAPSKSSQVLSVQMERQEMAVAYDFLRNSKRPLDIHKVHATNHPAAPIPRDSVPNIPGRFNCTREVKVTMRSAHGNCDGSDAESFQFTDQDKQEHVRAEASLLGAGPDLEYSRHDSLSTSKTSSCIKIDGTKTITGGRLGGRKRRKGDTNGNYFEVGNRTGRKGSMHSDQDQGSCSVRGVSSGSIGSDTDGGPKTGARATLSLSRSQTQRMEQQAVPDGSSNADSSVVGHNKSARSQRLSAAPKAEKHQISLRSRCSLHSRVGCLAKRQHRSSSNDTGSLLAGGADATHQLPRRASTAKGLTSAPSSSCSTIAVASSGSNMSVRQHALDTVRKPNNRSLVTTLTPWNRIPRVAVGNISVNNVQAHCGRDPLLSGQTVTSSNGFSRLDPQQQIPAPARLQQVGQTEDRLVCSSKQRKGDPVLQLPARRRCRLDGRVLRVMVGKGKAVCLPSLQSNRKSSAQGAGGASQRINLDSSSVAIPSLVATSPCSSSRLPSSAASRTRPRTAAHGQQQMVTSMGDSRVEYLRHWARRLDLGEGALQEQFSKLKHGYPTAYDQPWKVFHKWYIRTQSTDFSDCARASQGVIVTFLRSYKVNHTSLAAVELARTSLSTAFAFSTAGERDLAKEYLVRAHMDGLKVTEPLKVLKKHRQKYVDPALVLEYLFTLGPNGCLTTERLAKKFATLSFIDLAARPSDLASLLRISVPAAFKTMKSVSLDGNEVLQLRYFWPKEVRPRSSRKNSTGTFFSTWVNVHNTTPSSLDWRATMVNYMTRTTGHLFQTKPIAELLTDGAPTNALPMFYITRLNPKTRGYTSASSDTLSNWCQSMMSEAGVDINVHETYEFRASSTSKIMQLAPQLKQQALDIGRWTTDVTHKKHYHGEIEYLGDPGSFVLDNKTPQQILRYGAVWRIPELVSQREFKNDDPNYWVDRQVSKQFQEGWFDGKVVNFHQDTGFHIKYEDDDEEDVEYHILLKLIANFRRKNCSMDDDGGRLELNPSDSSSTALQVTKAN